MLKILCIKPDKPFLSFIFTRIQLEKKNFKNITNLENCLRTSLIMKATLWVDYNLNYDSRLPSAPKLQFRSYTWWLNGTLWINSYLLQWFGHLELHGSPIVLPHLPLLYSSLYGSALSIAKRNITTSGWHRFQTTSAFPALPISPSICLRFPSPKHPTQASINKPFHQQEYASQ